MHQNMLMKRDIHEYAYINGIKVKFIIPSFMIIESAVILDTDQELENHIWK